MVVLFTLEDPNSRLSFCFWFTYIYPWFMQLTRSETTFSKFFISLHHCKWVSFSYRVNLCGIQCEYSFGICKFSCNIRCMIGGSNVKACLNLRICHMTLTLFHCDIIMNGTHRYSLAQQLFLSDPSQGPSLNEFELIISNFFVMRVNKSNCTNTDAIRLLKHFFHLKCQIFQLS